MKPYEEVTKMDVRDYVKKVEDDIMWLLQHSRKAPERGHIVGVLMDSVEKNYGSGHTFDRYSTRDICLSTGLIGEDCPYCTGESCEIHDFNTPCNCDASERHAY